MEFLQEFSHIVISSNTLILSLLFLFPLLLTLLTKNRSTRLNLPLSPPRLPIIGNLHQVGRLPHRSLAFQSEKYGPLMLLHFGSVPILVVSSADVADEILKNHDLKFSNRPHMKAVSCLLYEGRDMITCPYGEYWRQGKKICVNHLLNQRTVRALHSTREEEVSDMLKRINNSCLKGSEPINLSEIFTLSTSNVVYRSATGRRVDWKAYNMSHGEWMKKVKNLLEAFCFADIFPSLGWMDNLTGLNRALQRTFMEIDDYLGKIIDDHTTRINDHENVSGNRDFVDIILCLQRDGLLDIDLSRDDLKGILNSIFSAATETTSTALEWAMTELAKNPRAMKKTQDEIRRVVGNKLEIIGPTDINQMHHLKCIIKECLRLHSFGMAPRETREALRLCGYDIPTKMGVLINIWRINRDEKVWVKPDEFIPERFMDTQVDYLGEYKGFIPFGFGRRKCPGASYAVAFLEAVLANLLYRYDWELPTGTTPDDVDMEERLSFAINKKNPLYLVPKPLFPVHQASVA